MNNDTGMTAPKSDKDFLLSMVLDRKGHVNAASLEATLSAYPELGQYLDELPAD